uniref:DUF4329 domain-containing protein n=1 Tax=Heterorhabditis bacteriophora TaxID=37862 RepID=A0A1I7WDU4_HETBA
MSDLDDISVGYGQNLSPIDPFALMPDDRKTNTNYIDAITR